MKKVILFLYLALVFITQLQGYQKEDFLVGDFIQTTNKNYYLLLDVLASPVTQEISAKKKNSASNKQPTFIQ